MLIIGITGGSGAGKSAAAKIFGKLGAVVVSADEIYHELLKSDIKMLSELQNRFPDSFTSGSLDRSVLRKIAFADTSALEDLNAITHKHVIREINRIIGAARNRGEIAAVLEAIYLLESGFAPICDLTVAVTAPLEKRLERIMLRDGLTQETALERINSQKPDEYYTGMCDRIVKNDGCDDELADKVCELWDDIFTAKGL